MMKGFTVTPVLFVGILVIVGIMMITFTTFDKNFTNALSDESAVSGASSKYQAALTSAESYVMLTTAQLASQYNETGRLVEESEKAGIYLIDCGPDYLTAAYAGTFQAEEGGVTIDRTIEIEKVVNCDAIEVATGKRAKVDCGLDCT